jgi:hypothetical protein
MNARRHILYQKTEHGDNQCIFFCSFSTTCTNLGQSSFVFYFQRMLRFPRHFDLIFSVKIGEKILNETRYVIHVYVVS